MAKKYIIYASGKDLALVPVTQNEVGKYYRNSAGTYFKPILAEFDTATLPSGYKTYIGGSHAKYVSNLNRNPIDFSLVAGTVLSMNVDVNVLATNPSDGSWCKITPVGSNYVIALVHTYQWAKGLVKAGSPICKIAPQSVTGFAPHLHLDEWANKGRKIRKLILDGDFKMSTFKAGDKIVFSDIQNIRKGSGTSFEITGKTQAGMVATIEGSPREANGYTWYDLVGYDWVADVGKFKIYTAPEPIPPVVVEPVDPCKELREAVGALEGKLEVEKERVSYVEGLLAGKNDEIKDLEGQLAKALEDSKRFEKQYMDVVEELNELKQNHWTELLRKDIVELWNKYKEAILKLIKGQ